MTDRRQGWDSRLKRLMRDRNIILILALALGLLWGAGARWTEEIILPLLILVMTISTIGIRGRTFLSLKASLPAALTGIVLNYFVLGTFILGLNALLIHDEDIWTGFVILAATPPAIAVLPFTLFFNGDTTYALLGTIGAYLGAFIITPMLAIVFLGTNFAAPSKLVFILAELILLPLIFSRIVARTPWADRIHPLKGPITNWSFFILTYTIVGLNRDVFLHHPVSLIPVAFIAFGSTLVLGQGILAAGTFVRADPKKLISLMFLGTLKNYGLAGGLALSLFTKKSAVPSTVSVVFMILYVIWLEFKKRRGTLA